MFIDFPYPWVKNNDILVWMKICQLTWCSRFWSISSLRIPYRIIYESIHGRCSITTWGCWRVKPNGQSLEHPSNIVVMYGDVWWHAKLRHAKLPSVGISSMACWKIIACSSMIFPTISLLDDTEGYTWCASLVVPISASRPCVSPQVPVPAVSSTSRAPSRQNQVKWPLKSQAFGIPGEWTLV
jgi:hypothetical protein